jgi:hypothetical protein
LGEGVVKRKRSLIGTLSFEDEKQKARSGRYKYKCKGHIYYFLCIVIEREREMLLTSLACCSAASLLAIHPMEFHSKYNRLRKWVFVVYVMASYAGQKETASNVLL